LGAIVGASSLVSLAFGMANRGPEQNILRLAEEATWSLVLVAFTLLGALILSRQPRNLVGWLLMVPGALSVLSWPAESFLHSLAKSQPPASLPLLLAAWFTTWEWVMLIFPLLLIPLVFPTGRPPSPRWRWVFRASIGLGLFFILFVTFSRILRPLENVDWEIVNPIGFIPESMFDVIEIPWILALGSLTLACVASLFVRFRRASLVEREQIKWLLYACGLFVVVFVPGFIISDMEGTVFDVWGLLLSLSILTLPVSITIAILRYRLWDIDVIIRRTLVYGLLTTMLALVYFGGVVIFQQIFNRVSGEAGQSPLAIVLSTLAIAALFTPLRRRIQHSIDRRFFRRKYNTELVLQAFAASLRDEVDLEQLNGHLVNVVAETMQPSSVSLWLREPEKG
jgi:hypothetical protein